MGVFLLLDPCWFVHLSNLSCLFIVLDTTKSPTHSYHHPLPNNIEYRGHNYRVISGNLSWYNAMVMCRENHFDLVSIMDAYHQAFLTVLVNRLGAPHWIGLHSELPVCILHEKHKCFVSLVCCCSFLLYFIVSDYLIINCFITFGGNGEGTQRVKLGSTAG